ncbi:tRNA(Ile)-lysidine synthase [Sporomusa rhizae]|uniref:tRNA lysidine(34) synthetase TilS n=1 Tax=Sporomusa rhizae TaxID=357999 RepID=UPI00352A16D1
MLDKVKNWANNHNIFMAGSRILAACSGGPDSLALVHLLNSLKEEYSFGLAVAHVNHQFRPEAAEEAEFVAAFSAKLGLTCHVTSIDVPAYAKANRLSPEEAGRLLRYQYLRRIAADWGGARIATGHHRDDQVETVLIHFLRGAGSGGLRGMRAVNGDILRPLLAVSRKEIEEYCILHQLQPCQDSSNFTTDYLRNRVRLELLPELEKSYNPALRDAIWRLAVLAGDEYEYIKGQAAKLWGTIAKEGKSITIDSQGLARQHKAVQREIIRQAIEKKRGALTGISFEHVEKLLTMVLSATVGSLYPLPGGLVARKTYTGLELGEKTEFVKPVFLKASEPVVLTIPGATAYAGRQITAEIVTKMPQTRQVNTAIFDLEQLSLPLTVRTRLPGDRFRPMGLNGSKKLKEFFIDNKVPEAERDQVLLITDSQEIIWVSGQRQSQHGRITDKSKKILQLSITKREEF